MYYINNLFSLREKKENKQRLAQWLDSGRNNIVYVYIEKIVL